jgi:hypothetical protein
MAEIVQCRERRLVDEGRLSEIQFFEAKADASVTAG